MSDEAARLVESQLRDKWVGDPDSDARFQRRLKAMRDLGDAEKRFERFIIGTFVVFGLLLVGCIGGIFVAAMYGHP